MTARAWRVAAMAAVATSTLLSGCGRDGSATRARSANASDAPLSSTQAGGGSRYADGGQTSGGGRAGAATAGGGYSREDASERPPTPSFHGEPMWSDSRKYSAEENATYHFQHAGADVGAKTLDEFLTKVHQFVDHPPKDVQVITRSNGDRLLYDPKNNLFAVARADGAPRTIFKPTSGAAYWEEQKSAEAARANGGEPPRRYPRRSYGDSGGAGASTGGGQDGG